MCATPSFQTIMQNQIDRLGYPFFPNRSHCSIPRSHTPPLLIPPKHCHTTTCPPSFQHHKHPTFTHPYTYTTSEKKAPTNPHPSCLTSSSLDPIPPSSSPPNPNPISHHPPHLSLYLFSISQHTFPTNLSITQSFEIFIHFFVHAYISREGGMGIRGERD